MSDTDKDSQDPNRWELRDSIADSQFELVRAGEVLSWVRYRQLAPNRYFLLHTEVVHSRRGNGIGKATVEAVLQELRGRQAKVTAICPFVSGYLTRNARYDDLLDLTRP
ncbi:GNAT family N-acetyltransferase [Promicromonospora sukumoe]|uniref:GNAT family N-acetyltransferase n=1 Tax=Promicromonospora sukumoe TaxID=88382 RepID=UPI00036D3ED4|nr:GNAT family N-acetyltransferase [Promicromonospora sukumoe]